MKPLPPMPFISGSPIAAAAPTATAASKALPPFSRICRPADEAIGMAGRDQAVQPGDGGPRLHAAVGGRRFGGLLLRADRDDRGRDDR